MKKLLQLLALASACLFGANVWGAKPIAVWTNFTSDTEGGSPTRQSLTAEGVPYVLTDHGCTVDSEGNLVIGGGGVSLSSFNIDCSGDKGISILLETVSIPKASGTFATITLGANSHTLNLSQDISTSPPKLYIGYENAEGNQSQAYQNVLTRGWIMFMHGYNNYTDMCYKSADSETSTLVDKGTIRWSDTTTAQGFRIGALNASGTAISNKSYTAPLTGMKVKAIYLYDTRLSSIPTVDLTPAVAKATLSADEITWDNINWSPAPSTTVGAELTVSGAHNFEIGSAVSIPTFTTKLTTATTTDKVTLTGSGSLTIMATKIGTDTDISGITASLGDVMIEAGASLTVSANTTWTSVNGEGTLLLKSGTLNKREMENLSCNVLFAETVAEGTTLILDAGEEPGISVPTGATLKIRLTDATATYTSQAINDGGTILFLAPNGNPLEINYGTVSGLTFTPAEIPVYTVEYNGTNNGNNNFHQSYFRAQDGSEPIYGANNNSFWHAFCYGSGGYGNGAVLHISTTSVPSTDTTAAHKRFRLDFEPITLAGLLVDEGATGYALVRTDASRKYRLGYADKTTYFTLHEDFAIDLQGVNASENIAGDVVFDIDEGKTFTIDSDNPYTLNMNSASSIKMKNQGQLAFIKGTLPLTGKTLDLSERALVAADADGVAPLKGAVTLDETTVIKLPAGLQPNTKYKLVEPTSQQPLSFVTEKVTVGGEKPFTKIAVELDAEGYLSYAEAMREAATLVWSAEGTTWDATTQWTIQGTETTTTYQHGDSIVFNLTVPLTLDLAVDAVVSEMTVVGAKLTVTSTGHSLTAATLYAQDDVDVSGVHAVLGTLSIMRGKTVTVKDMDAYTTILATGEGSELAIVRQTSPKANATVTTLGGVKVILDAPSGENATAVNGVTINPQGGEIEVKGKYASSFVTTPTTTSTIVNFTDADITATESLKFGRVTTTFKNANISAVSLRTGDLENAGAATITQKSGVITLSSAEDGATATAILLGHWPNSKATYNLKGGSLVAEKGWMTLGHHSAVDMTISGGYLKVKGIQNSTKDGSPARCLSLTDTGRLEIGANGINTLNYTTITMGGTSTLHAYATSTIAHPIAISGSPTFSAVQDSTMTVNALTSATDTNEEARSATLTIGETTHTGTVILKDLISYMGTIKPAAGVTVVLEGNVSGTTVDLTTGGTLHLIMESKAHPVTLRVTGLKDDRSNLILTEAGDATNTPFTSAVTTNDDGTVTISAVVPTLTATGNCVFETATLWTDNAFPGTDANFTTGGDIIIDVSNAETEEVLITVNGQYENKFGTIYLRGAGKKVGFVMGSTTAGDVTTIGVLTALVAVHVEEGTTLILDGTPKAETGGLTFEQVIEGAGKVLIRGAVTLTETNTYSGGTTIAENATLSVTAANRFTGTFDGEGTLIATDCIPTADVTESWRGTVVITYSTDVTSVNNGGYSIDELFGLVNENSKLQVGNVAGYFTGTQTLENLEVVNEGLWLYNGSSSSLATLNIGNLIGRGKIKWTAGGNKDLGWTYRITITDVSDFTGKIEKRTTTDNRDNATAIVIGSTAASATATNKKITFCGNVEFNATAEPTFEAEGGIVVLNGTTFSGGAATMASDVTWPTGEGEVVKIRVSGWDGDVSPAIMTLSTADAPTEGHYQVYIEDATEPSNLYLVKDGTSLKVRRPNTTWEPTLGEDEASVSATWTDIWGAYPPGATEDMVITIPGNTTLTLPESGVTVKSLTVNYATGVTEGTLTLTGGGLTTTTTTINANTDVSGISATLGATTLATETTLTINAGAASVAGVGNSTIVKTGEDQANVTLATTGSPANYEVTAGTLRLANSSYSSGGGGSFGAKPSLKVATGATLIMDCRDIIGWNRGNTVTVAEVAGELKLIWVDKNETFSGRILLKDGGTINNSKNDDKFLLHNSAVIAVEDGATATLQGNRVKVNNGTPVFEVGANATLNVTAPISRAVELKKTGTGTVVISSAVTDNQALTIEGGVVRLTETGSIANGTVAINANTVLEFTNTSAKTFASAITGAGTIRLTGSAPVTFTGSLANFTGTIEGGTIAIPQNGTLNLGRATLGSGVTFELATEATAGTLILAAGEETGVSVSEGVTLKLALSDLQLIEGYTPATNLPNARYVMLAADGTPTEITEAYGTVNETTGAFTPRHSVWTPVEDSETPTDWNTETNWDPVGVPNNKVVEFADLTGKTEETVTISEDVTPKVFLVNNDTTKYTIGSTEATSGAIVGGIEMVKRGSGEVVLKGPSDGSTRIAELVLEEGTVTMGSDYALHAAPVKASGGVSSGANGSKLTIKGGTFDLNGKKAWDSSVWWLTDYSITMGGSAVTAKIIDTAETKSGITLYQNEQLLTYIGTYEDENGMVQYAPPATVEARLLGGYVENTAHTRIITVEQGAGSREDGAGYDLELKGELTNTPGRSDANVTLVKNGAGTLKISNTNNFAGLTVAEGTVILGHAEALATTTTIEVGATLDLNGHIEDGVVFAGAGTITSTAEVTLTVDHIRDFTGTITGNVKLAIDLSHVFEAGKLYDCTIDENNVTITGELPSDLLHRSNGVVTETVEPLDYQIRWMPVGDSITEGEANMGKPAGTGTNADRGGYRYQLWKTLKDGKQDVVTVGYRTGHKGTDEEPRTTDWAWHCGLYSGTIKPLSGNGAQYLNVESALENAGYPEIISLLLGINDVSKTSDISGLYEAWTDMVNKIATLRPQSKIVVSTLLPVYDSNDAARLDDTTEKRYNRFNKLVRDDAARKTGAFKNTNVIFIDVAKIALNDTFNAAYFMSATNVHPNETGSILVAKAFRLGFLEAIQDIRNDALAIAHVHNGEAGKVIVRLNKAPTTVTSATLKVGDVSITANGVKNDADPRVIEFALGSEMLPLQATTATLTLGGEELTATNSAGQPPVVEILGSYVPADSENNVAEVYSARQNIPSEYLEGFEPLKHYALGDAATAETLENIEKALTAGQISRVGYYFELKRENKPAQFVWVSMNADAFGDGEVNVGLPTTKIKAKVGRLQVYGNRGNFTNTAATDKDVWGIIEFSPYQWDANDENGYVNEGRDGSYGWNDALSADGNLKGCLQVARIRAGAADNWQDPAAEMLFAYNNFACGTTDDLGIGSFHTHLNNNGGSITSVFDWTNFASQSQYTAYQPGAYESRILEVWVEPSEIATWTGTVDGSWEKGENWEGGEVPASHAKVVLSASATHALTLTSGDYLNNFTGAGQLKIAEGATVSLLVANTHKGGTAIAANATLTVPDASALGSGKITGSGTLIYPAGYPSYKNGLTEAAWTGTVVLTDVTFAGASDAASSKSIELLGNANSTIQMNGNSSGKLSWTSSPVVCASPIVLNGTWSMNDGHNGWTMKFAGALSGEGTYICNPDREGYVIQFNDVDDFGGVIQVKNTDGMVRIGDANETFSAGQILIATGATATIYEGYEWSAVNGIAVKGTLRIDGNVVLDILDLSGGGSLAFEGNGKLTVNTLILGTNRTFMGTATTDKLTVTEKVILTEGAEENDTIPVTWDMSDPYPAVEVIGVDGETRFSTGENPQVWVETNATTGQLQIYYLTTLGGAGAHFEYLLEGDLNGTGYDTASLTQDGTPAYLTVPNTNPTRQALDISASQVYLGAMKYPQGQDWSATFYGRVPSNEGGVLVAFGATNNADAGTIALVRGHAEVEDQVLLVYIYPTAQTRHYEVLAKMKVPHATEEFHLYSFVYRTGNIVEIYVDAVRWLTYYGTAPLKLADGFQFGSLYSGIPDTDRGTALVDGELLPLARGRDVDGDETPAAVDMLRIYHCELSPHEVQRTVAEGYGYIYPIGGTREFIGSVTTADWVSTGAWTLANGSASDGPTHGVAMITNKTEQAVTITMNTTADAHLGGLVLEGAAMSFIAPTENLHHRVVEGVTTVNADVTIDCNAISLEGPVDVKEGKTLTLKLTDALLTKWGTDYVTTGAAVEKNLTGNLLGTGTVQVQLTNENNQWTAAEGNTAANMTYTANGFTLTVRKDTKMNCWTATLTRDAWEVEIDENGNVTWAVTPTTWTGDTPYLYLEGAPIHITANGDATLNLNGLCSEATVTGTGVVTFKKSPVEGLVYPNLEFNSLVVGENAQVVLGETVSVKTLLTIEIDAVLTGTADQIKTIERIEGGGTCYVTSGHFTVPSGKPLMNVRIRVAAAADGFELEKADSKVEASATLILDGGAKAYFKCGNGGYMHAPIIVESGDNPAEIYACLYGSMTFTHEVTLNGDLNLEDGGGCDDAYTISGLITGDGKLTVKDQGVTLTGENTFTGGLVVNNNLTADNDAVGVGDITIASGKTLTIGSDTKTVTIPATKMLAGSGTLAGSLSLASGSYVDARNGAVTVTGSVIWPTNGTPNFWTSEDNIDQVPLLISSNEITVPATYQIYLGTSSSSSPLALKVVTETSTAEDDTTTTTWKLLATRDTKAWSSDVLGEGVTSIAWHDIAKTEASTESPVVGGGWKDKDNASAAEPNNMDAVRIVLDRDLEIVLPDDDEHKEQRGPLFVTRAEGLTTIPTLTIVNGPLNPANLTLENTACVLNGSSDPKTPTPIPFAITGEGGHVKIMDGHVEFMQIGSYTGGTYIPADASLRAATMQGLGTVTGSGTLIMKDAANLPLLTYNGNDQTRGFDVAPTSAEDTDDTDDWRGTLEFATLVNDDTLGNYGNAHSKIRFTGNFTGCFGLGFTCAAELILDGTINLANGYGGAKYILGPLSGMGTWTTSNTSIADTYYFETLKDFEGRLETGHNHCVVIGTDAQTRANSQIIVAAGATAKLAESGVLSAAQGVVVKGTLSGCGTVEGDLILAAGATIDATAGLTTAETLIWPETGTVTFKVPQGAQEDACVLKGASLSLPLSTVTISDGGTTDYIGWGVASTSEGLVLTDSPSTDYEAVVNGQHYATVEQAALAAGAGDTVQVLKSVTVETLDLRNNATLDFAPDATLTVQNLLVGTNRAFMGNGTKDRLVVTDSVLVVESRVESDVIPVTWTLSDPETVTLLIDGMDVDQANKEGLSGADYYGLVGNPLKPTVALEGNATSGYGIYFETALTGEAAWYEYLFRPNEDGQFDASALLSTGFEKAGLQSHLQANNKHLTTLPEDAFVAVDNYPERRAVKLAPHFVWTNANFAAPETWAVTTFAKMPTKAGEVVMWFGTTTVNDKRSLALVRGPAQDQVLLVAVQGKNHGDVPFTVLATMSVPNADAAYHLYTFVNRPNTIDVYCDDAHVAQVEENINVAYGFQMGSPFGAAAGTGYLNYARYTATVQGVPMQLLRSDETSTAAVDMIRIYDCELSLREIQRTQEEGYRYISPNPSYTRVVSADGDWKTESPSWTEGDGVEPSATAPAAIAGEVTVEVNSTADTTLTLNLTEATTYEYLTFKAANEIANPGQLTVTAGADTAAVMVSGVTQVKTDVAVDTSAVHLYGTVVVSAGKTLKLQVNESQYEMWRDELETEIERVGNAYVEKTHMLTGLVELEEGAQVVYDASGFTVPKEYRLRIYYDNTTHNYNMAITRAPVYAYVTKTADGISTVKYAYLEEPVADEAAALGLLTSEETYLLVEPMNQGATYTVPNEVVYMGVAAKQKATEAYALILKGATVAAQAGDTEASTLQVRVEENATLVIAEGTQPFALLKEEGSGRIALGIHGKARIDGDKAPPHWYVGDPQTGELVKGYKIVRNVDTNNTSQTTDDKTTYWVRRKGFMLIIK